jgi:parvulin-like peptidyl-prolyl isomerase
MTRTPSIPSLLVASSFILAASPAVPAAPAKGGWTTVDSVIAVVNADVVLRSELDRRMAGLKPQLDAIKDAAERAKKRVEATEQVTQSLIDERLMAQEATRIGLGVSDQELERAVAEVKAKNKLDDAGLTKALKEQGLTLAQYREELRSQIAQAKVVNILLRPRVQITEQELRAAYDDAKKRDPQRIGTFDEVKQPLAERIFEEKMVREQRAWLAERRADAYIDMRTR